MKPPSLVLAAGLLAALAAPAPAKPRVVRTTPVTSEFPELKLNWNGGQIPAWRGRWKVKVGPDDMIEICGAGSTMDAARSAATREWLAAIYITYEGRKILKDVSFFTKVPKGADLLKATANCASTGVRAPKGDFSVTLGWPAG